MATISPCEWNGIIDRVQARHPNLARHWFDQLQGADLEFGVLEVVCANAPQQRYLGRHCTKPFCEAAQEETGRLISVRFVLPEHRDNGNGQAGAPAMPALFSSGSASVALNSAYQFEEFVTGPCNRLAHAACLAVSSAPGETYNPLFIHGESGLGKTHLLQAICQQAGTREPHLQILYLSCETFNNHFIEAVEQGALHQFRFRYRHVDILVIDDIQFLAGPERSQEELFHPFNTLYQSRKQIVLSADCGPREIPSLEDRLISRFNWGLVARIDPPCMETRIAIIRKKARRRNIHMPDAVVDWLAATVETNARELEGVITKVDAYCQDLGVEIDLAAARAALCPDSHVERERVTIPAIVSQVCDHFGVTKSAIHGKRRTKSIAFPRQVCMHLARDLTDHSLGEIGRAFGGRDHTTVLHSTRRIEALRQDDPDLTATLEALKRRIKARITSERG